ncbi:ABC transporter ATP-binding protein [Pseudoscardovia radai]|uniref:ABC transporter ATP-binding protein n=1 Tax=Pseudoscardovia radai TaxID=987066 RepID=UPI0039921E0D
MTSKSSEKSSRDAAASAPSSPSVPSSLDEETIITAAGERHETTEEALESPDTTDDLPEDVVLRVNHVSKVFRLPTERASGLKQAFINWTRGIKGYREQQVLRDISFDVHRGDFFGIVGRNGSGKSTLLKLISGIYVPESGQIMRRGKLVPFIELGVGFNPELTGRENVYLNGALLGFSRTEIDAMYDDIVQFAELEDFMDQKLKNYSSGMQVRLAFSVAIKAQGDILVLDEVLAVGDEAFQRKCNNFFASIKKDPTKTVILVTHDMGAVKKYCNRAILIKDGRIVESGNKDDVADRYSLENLEPLSAPAPAPAPAPAEGEGAGEGSGEAGASGDAAAAAAAQPAPEQYPLGLNARVPLLRVNAVSSPVVSSDDEFTFDVEYRFDEKTPFFLTFALQDMTRGGTTYEPGMLPMTRTGHQKVSFTLPMRAFTSTDFKIVASLSEPDPENPEETQRIAFTNNENSLMFTVRNDGEKTHDGLIKQTWFDLHQHYEDMDAESEPGTDAESGATDAESDKESDKDAE